jgi:hypothetical protein
MTGQYNDREIIDSFYLQGGCPNNTDGICKTMLCQSGGCICPDQEQMILLLAQWDKKLDGQMTFLVKPFWRHGDEGGCRDAGLPQQTGSPSLIKISMQDEKLVNCLKHVSEHEMYRGEKLMQAVPFVLGINSRFEIADRESTVRFCLEPGFGGGVFQSIMQIVLSETLECLIDNEDTHHIRLFVKDFFEKLKMECCEDEQLNVCVGDSYDAIARSLRSRQMILLNNKYRVLRKRWVNRPLKCQGDLMKCMTERFEGWRNILLLIYTIQAVYSERGTPLILPEAFRGENLSAVLEGIPGVIRKFLRTVRGLLNMRDCQEKNDIGSQLACMVRQSDLNWDEELLEELHNRVERAIRNN